MGTRARGINRAAALCCPVSLKFGTAILRLKNKAWDANFEIGNKVRLASPQQANRFPVTKTKIFLSRIFYASLYTKIFQSKSVLFN